MTDKFKILFLCTGNSCRSQMAEGLAHHLKGDIMDAYSAGLEAHGLNPYAVRVMEEVGIDISRQQSKTLDDLGKTHFDYVITLCGHSDEHCPLVPGATGDILYSSCQAKKIKCLIAIGYTSLCLKGKLLLSLMMSKFRRNLSPFDELMT